MSLSLTRGKTFTGTELVTAAKLHQLVDSATGSGIDQADLAGSYGTIYKGTSEPADNDAAWNHTTLGQLMWYNSLLSAYSGPAGIMRMTAYENLAAGDLVWPYNDGGTLKARKVRVGVPATPVCDGPSAIGTAMTTATTDGTAYICTGGGPCYFLCDETLSPGAAVRPSESTAGRVEGADQGDADCVGFLLASGSAGNAALGIFVPVARAPAVYAISTRPYLLNDTSSTGTISWTDCDCTSHVKLNTSPTHAVIFLRTKVTGASVSPPWQAVNEVRKEGSSITYGNQAQHMWHFTTEGQTSPEAAALFLVELDSGFTFEFHRTVTSGSCSTSAVAISLHALVHMP